MHMHIDKSIAVALLFIGLSACGDGGGTTTGGKLGGSVETQYDLTFDAMTIERQESGGSLVAMIVQYIRGAGTDQQEIPVKLVVTAPITAGQDKDLSSGATVTHLVRSNAQFPALIKGTAKFSTLESGKSCAGTFFATFETDTGQSTLNGEFSGVITVIK